MRLIGQDLAAALRISRVSCSKPPPNASSHSLATPSRLTADAAYRQGAAPSRAGHGARRSGAVRDQASAARREPSRLVPAPSPSWRVSSTDCVRRVERHRLRIGSTPRLSSGVCFRHQRSEWTLALTRPNRGRSKHRPQSSASVPETPQAAVEPSQPGGRRCSTVRRSYLDN